MEPTHKPRYIVAQTGARRGYAVPAILEKAGMLEHFYTDVCGNVGWGRWLAAGARLPFIGSSLKKLANRRVPDSVASKTHTFAKANLRWQGHRLLHPQESQTSQFRADVEKQMQMGNDAAAMGFGDATHLYVMFSEFPSLMRKAKASGLKVVSEVYTLYSTNVILEREREEFPGWEPDPLDKYKVLLEQGLECVLFDSADHYICPSDNVANDLHSAWGVPRQKISLVPYGMSPSWLSLEPQPIPGRILFVGSAILRKGIHYLGMAAEELRKRGRNYEFRIAGHVIDSVRQQPICKNLNFLGRIPRDKVHEEFQMADVFTLPSLAEGSAEVNYEAMASALPIVTTEASGSVATDGIEGLIVPERDPVALANALEAIIENRAGRDRMAAAARTTARNYTWDRYGERLITVLQKL